MNIIKVQVKSRKFVTISFQPICYTPHSEPAADFFFLLKLVVGEKRFELNTHVVVDSKVWGMYDYDLFFSLTF
jgi:hypothetical protein